MNNEKVVTAKNISSKYVYFINSKIGQKDICDLEMKAIFGVIPNDKYIISDTYIEPSRSIFINGCLTILNQGSSIDSLEQDVLTSQLEFEEYKIKFVNMCDYVEYDERLNALRTIGFAIEGSFAIKNPEVPLAITKIDGLWIFGHYLRNDNEWQNRVSKPFSYSNALEVQLAKTIVNIAVGNDFDLKLIDPCCGIGTVIIEARLMDIDITGYDYNRSIVSNCNKNLKHFNLEPDVKKVNMLELTDTYDVAILDLPYGQFSLTSLEEQTALITKTKSLAKKAMIVTMEDMEDLIIKCGFNIIDKCLITKSNAFSRYLYTCN